MKKNYKAYIADNGVTPAFDSAVASTPNEAVEKVKKNNTDWEDCFIWCVYLHSNGEEEKIFTDEYF